ncbi:glutamate--tRNA ligase family protein [Flavihumibacter sp. UBA7668]|uniref:glutamate--tRNA ligase family protein n=1 Tax=Flavihumibacter sp. UBA7668 TaxID=1946542 RepID=UPI0025BF54EC|nr:glutamate--tRNA ligase family protein [Flavihumibacter sp. UBA7668]
MHPEEFNNTRYAPTPSGYLHLGNLYSFIVTAILARENGLKIFLRIDDMDRDRYRPEFLENIFEVLRYFDFPWDFGPSDKADFERQWAQQYRLQRYTHALETLRQQGFVYASSCTRSDQQKVGLESGCVKGCSDAQLSLNAAGFNWRFRTPEEQQELVLATGERVVYPFPFKMKDFVIRRRDGNPAYQLCSVIDDQQFRIGWVIRGMDLLDSSIAQMVLSKALKHTAYTQIKHIHHPLLTSADGSKLSKSDGADSLHDLLKKGVSSSEILTLLAEQLGIHRTIAHWSDFNYCELTSKL